MFGSASKLPAIMEVISMISLNIQSRYSALQEWHYLSFINNPLMLYPYHASMPANEQIIWDQSQLSDCCYVSLFTEMSFQLWYSIPSYEMSLFHISVLSQVDNPPNAYWDCAISAYIRGKGEPTSRGSYQNPSAKEVRVCCNEHNLQRGNFIVRFVNCSVVNEAESEPWDKAHRSTRCIFKLTESLLYGLHLVVFQERSLYDGETIKVCMRWYSWILYSVFSVVCLAKPKWSQIW